MKAGDLALLKVTILAIDSQPHNCYYLVQYGRFQFWVPEAQIREVNE